MDDRQIGAIVRLLLGQRGFRQVDVADRARVPRAPVVNVEAGRLAGVTVGRARAVAEACGAWLDIRLRTPGDDAIRLLDAVHAVLQGTAVEMLQRLGWEVVPEASFSSYGERGVIDLLVWHPKRRVLLIVEVKTLLVEVGALLASMDRRLRLAHGIAAERGWRPLTVGTWIAIRDTPTNRRRLASSVGLLRSSFPDDGRAVRRWLTRPERPLRGLGFLSDVRDSDLRERLGPPRRVPRPVAHSAFARPGPRSADDS